MNYFERSVTLYINGIKVSRLENISDYSLIIVEISKKLKPGIPVLVLIHGMAGSGKSTLAAKLSSELLECFVVSHDNFVKRGNEIDRNTSKETVARCMKGVLDFLFSLKVNVILEISDPGNLMECLGYDHCPECYELCLIEFDPISPEESCRCTIHRPDLDASRYHFDEWRAINPCF